MHARLCGGPKNKLASKQEQSRCSSPGCFHPRALIDNYQSNKVTDVHRRKRESGAVKGFNCSTGRVSAETRRRSPVLSPCFSQLSAFSPLCANSFPSNRLLRGRIIRRVLLSKGTHLTVPTYQIQLTTERAEPGLYGARLAHTHTHTPQCKSWHWMLKRSLHSLMSSFL